MSEAEHAIDHEEFEDGHQRIKLKTFSFIHSHRTKNVFAKFTLFGADEKNRYANTDLMFKISEDVDGNKRLIRFVRSLGFEDKIRLPELEDQMSSMMGKVYWADVTSYTDSFNKKWFNFNNIKESPEPAFEGQEEPPF
jgi:hypothetical protein